METKQRDFTIRRNWKHFILAVAILTIAALVVVHFGRVYGLFRTGLGLITPFFIGLGIAYIWNLIMEPIERLLFGKAAGKRARKLKRPVSVVLSLLIILGIIALVLYLVIPQLYESVRVIAQAVPVLARDLQNWFLEVTAGLDWTEELRDRIRVVQINWGELTSRIAGFLRSGVGGFLGSTMNILGNVAGFFVAAFTALLFAVYILFGKEKIGGELDRTGRAYLRDAHMQRIRYVLGVMDQTFSNFFKGQLLDAFIVGVLLFVAMLITRLPNALTISVVVMVLALIPMVGAFIGGAVGFLMIAVQDLRQAVIFLIVLVIVQQLEGDLIYPKIVGDSIGLPGIWVFAAVIIGGAVAGPFGMILGVPLVAGIYRLLGNDVNRRLALRTEREAFRG